MKTSLLALLCSGVALTAGSGQTILWSDNFDAADNANFDATPIDGRLSGTIAGETRLRSWGAQQQINNNQLLIPVGGNTGVRFENEGGPYGGANRYDWAAGSAAATILANGNFVVSFDWYPAGNTSPDWISFQVGTDNADTGNLTNDDYGILFRQNGGTQRFANNTGLGNGDPFPASEVGVARHVEITYKLDSFADGATVNVISTIDGLQVADDTFTWQGNGGAMRMELGSNDAGNRVDNLTVATRPAVYDFGMVGDAFTSGDPQGTLVGTLAALFGTVPEDSTFALVAGEGDTDNDKFQISGAMLELGAYDFKGANSVNGQQFTVRIQGTSVADALKTTGKTFVVTVTKDDDLDDLPDAWELQWAADLSVLSGLSLADTDSDSVTDLEEYQLSIGIFPGFPAYPLLDPTAADTDMDGQLSDGDELFPFSLRPPTDPTSLDTDLDGLGDLAESNTGFFENADDTGTDPTNPDWDDDGARDGWELANGGDMYLNTVFPDSVSPSVTVTRITDDASSLISNSKVYTHKISGGGAATVNGVSFDILDITTTPADFAWTPRGGIKNIIAPVNNGDWLPVDGGVTGPGLLDLLGGFAYSNSEANPGGLQTYTLSGLTPGEDYILRLYIRIWDTEGPGRKIDLTFTNGAEVVVPYGGLPEDRPAFVLGSDNQHEAYFLTYTYTAQGTELVIGAGSHRWARSQAAASTSTG